MFLFKRKNTLANLDKLVELTSNNRYSVSFSESEKQLKQLKQLSSLKFCPGKSIDSSYVETLTNIVNSQKGYDSHQAKFKEVESKYTSIKLKVLEGKLSSAMLKHEDLFKQKYALQDKEMQIRKDYPVGKVTNPEDMLIKIKQDRSENYKRNGGGYYTGQSEKIQYLANAFNSIHKSKILRDLYESGERPGVTEDSTKALKITDRIYALKSENIRLTEIAKDSGYFSWIFSQREDQRKKAIEDQIEKNKYIIKQYEQLKDDNNNLNDKLLWQEIGVNIKEYIDKKVSHDRLKKLPKFEFTIDEIHQEEKSINNSKFYKNERYYDAKEDGLQKLIENNQELLKISEDINASSDVISSIRQEINELDPNYKKLPEDKVRRFFEEAGNLAIGATTKSFDKVKSLILDLFSKNGNFPEKILMDVEDTYSRINAVLDNRSLDTILCLSWLCKNEINVDILTKNPVENVENINKAFKSVFKYASIHEFCNGWEGIYKSNDEYLKTTEKMLGKPINDFINAYYNNESDKSKAIGYKDELLGHSIKLSKRLNNINNNIIKCNEKAAIGAKTANEALSKRYKNMNDLIVGVCKNIGGNSEKEIIRKRKNYQDEKKRKKLWLFQREKTLKVYSENLRAHNDLIYIGANLKDDLTYLNKTSLLGARESCNKLINNINYHREILGSFDKILSERKNLIKEDMIKASFNSGQDDAMSKQFFIGELPKLNGESTNDYNTYFEIDIPKFINKSDDSSKNSKNNKSDDSSKDRKNNIRDSFSKNRKYFKRNPYMAKMWSSAIKERMNGFRDNEVKQTYTNFQSVVGDSDDSNLINASYEKLTRNFTDLDKFFDRVKTGELVYEDMDIFGFFNEEFWRYTKNLFNDLRTIFQFFDVTGPYLEIFKDITPLKAIRYAIPFIKFYIKWIKEVSPNFLDFDSVKNKVMNEMTDSKYSNDNRLIIEKYCKVLKNNIKLFMIPEFFDTNLDIKSKLDTVLCVLATAAKTIFNFNEFLKVIAAIRRIPNESDIISRLLYPQQYEVRDGYFKREKLNDKYKLNLGERANQNKQGLGRIAEQDEQEIPKFLKEDLLEEKY